MQNIDQLNASFAIPGVLSFDEHNGLDRARITTPACTAELYLQGAHITAWQPAGTEPVLFLSDRSAFAPGSPTTRFTCCRSCCTRVGKISF